MASLAASPFRTGLWAGLPYDQYARLPGVNHSNLRLFAKTPAHAREAMIREPEPTDALTLGVATHVAVLEPDAFDLRYARGLVGIDKRTKAGKAEWADFEAANRSRIVLMPDEYDASLKMSASVWAHETAAALLSEGLDEVSMAWIDGPSGIPAKGRLDHVGPAYGYPFIADLKSSRDASQRAWERDIVNFGYHEQAAFYLDGANTLAPEDRRFVHIVVEKTPPYAVAVYEMDDAAIDQGRSNYRRHLKQYQKCKETGIWPGFPVGILPISLPAWAFKTHVEED